MACELFLALNDAVLQASNVELYPVYLSLADGSLTEAEFATWLRPRLRLETNGAVNEPKPHYRRAR